MRQRNRLLMIAIALCLLFANMASGAESVQRDQAQETFRMFQDAMAGLVTGDSNAVLKGSTVHFVKEIVDANRKTLIEKKNDGTMRARFEKITGVPYDKLLAMSDRELAVVVIDKLIPLTRTEEEKKKLVSLMRRSVMRDAKLQNGTMILHVTYPEGEPDNAVFIKEDGGWRLDRMK